MNKTLAITSFSLAVLARAPCLADNIIRMNAPIAGAHKAATPTFTLADADLPAAKLQRSYAYD